MCLTQRFNWQKPYNTRNIRWKIVAMCEGKMTAPFYGTEYTKKNVVNKIDFYTMEQVGFHVFTSRKIARQYIQKRSYYNTVLSTSLRIEKVIVGDFKMSGEFISSYGCFDCEIWRKMEFVNYKNNKKKGN